MSPFNVDKTHHWPVISPLSAHILKHLKEFFFYISCVPAGPSKSLCLLLLICCGYANYKANRGFVIIFSICSDLLNDLRRTRCYHMQKNKKWLNSIEIRVITILMYSLSLTRQIQSTIQPKFPDYLLVSYDDELIEVAVSFANFTGKNMCLSIF